jgi:hypothetical protein
MAVNGINGGSAVLSLRIPTIATTCSGGMRPPIPTDRDQAADGYDPSRRVTAVMSVWRALVKGERPSR